MTNLELEKLDRVRVELRKLTEPFPIWTNECTKYWEVCCLYKGKQKVIRTTNYYLLKNLAESYEGDNEYEKIAHYLFRRITISEEMEEDTVH